VRDNNIKHHPAGVPTKQPLAAGVFDLEADHLHKLLGRPGYSDTELWFGHRQSVVHTESGPLLQVDLACTTMLAPIGTPLTPPLHPHGTPVAPPLHPRCTTLHPLTHALTGVLDFICMKLRCNTAMQLDITYGSEGAYQVNKHLKGRHVRSNHNGHKWKVRGLARSAANQTYFIVDEGTSNQHTTTVADFFSHPNPNPGPNPNPNPNPDPDH
jgi:hypothetical protein